jgi:hypothetical protein
VVELNNKGLGYFYVIVGLAFIIIGVTIGILANTGTFEQVVNSETLLVFNAHIIILIVAFILVLIGVLVLGFGSRKAN